MRLLLCSYAALFLCSVSVVHSRISSSRERADLVVSDQEAFAGLVAFVRSGGGIVSPSLRLSEGPPRGIATSQAIPTGETLLVVPPQLLLTGGVATQRGSGCAVGRLLSECGDEFDDDCASLLPVEGEGDAHSVRRSLELAVFLVTRLYGRESEGNTTNRSYSCETDALPFNFFDPYLRSLPNMESMLSHPVFAVAELPCRQAIGSTQLGVKVNTMRDKWARQWGILVRRVPELQQYHSDEFFHAKLLVLSRAFGTTNQVNSPLEPVMVPLADMLNMDLHDRPEVSWQASDVRTQGFRMTTAKAMSDGSIVLGSYGLRPNDEQYAHYGFFQEDQSFEAVPLDLRPCVHRLAEGKAARIDAMLAGYPPRVQLQFKPSLLTIFQDVLAFARVVALVNASEPAPNHWSPDTPLPLRLERCAMEALSAHVEDQALKRAGSAGAATLQKSIELSSSSCSDSCQQYSRLTLEPYGALLDFAQEGTIELDRRLGKSPDLIGKAQVSPLRHRWASSFVTEWTRQLGMAETRIVGQVDVSSAQYRSNISHLSLGSRLRKQRALQASP